MKPVINPPHPNQIDSDEEINQKKFYLDKVAKYCDKCGKSYDLDDVTILQRNQFSTIIHFSCKNCKARHLATFVRPLGLASRMPINTDLSLDELPRFVGLDAVTSNDVIDVHELMNGGPTTLDELLSS